MSESDPLRGKISTAVRQWWCGRRGHDFRPCGYVLSYRPGGRRYTDVCVDCGAERTDEERTAISGELA